MHTFKEFLEIMKEIKERHERGELDSLTEAPSTQLTKDMVKAVYRRDYLKTRNKPYRKYSRQKRAKKVSTSTTTTD